MKRFIWVVLGIVPVVAAGLVVVLSRGEGELSTGSPGAAAAYLQGRTADMKLYRTEATGHYEEAVSLDPGFVVAKLLLANHLDKSEDARAQKLLAEVRSADLTKLNPSERFLVSYNLARRDHKYAEATRILEEHLNEHPRDSFALFSRCSELWARPDWESAGRCYNQLLELDPNWVLAYNYLGYIAMAQGRFAEAEKNFLAYRYLAPDQANPHDSLGELLTLVGRYEEAERELNEALRVKPDFCDSYRHLLWVALLEGDVAKAAAVTLRAKEGKQCPNKLIEGIECEVAVWKPLLAGDWEGVWRAAEGSCAAQSGSVPILLHQAALRTARTEQAKSQEEKVRKYLEESPASPELGGEFVRAGLEHMEGARLLAEAHASDAVTKFASADRKMAYIGDGQGIFKLFNQLALAHALSAAGRSDKAREVLDGVRAINPKLATRFGEGSPFFDVPAM